jgi:hypothetical protein
MPPDFVSTHSLVHGGIGAGVVIGVAFVLTLRAAAIAGAQRAEAAHAESTAHLAASALGSPDLAAAAACAPRRADRSR